MAALPSLKGLQAFEAAARSGSFAAAAEELSISAAAVSQLIRTVEEQMGRKLFHRVNRRVVLTEAGVEMLPRLTLAFEEIGSIARGGDAFRPRLVISVPPSMAMGWLSQRLAGFVASHGAVDISLRGDDDPVPFDRELIDIRLSFGPHYREHPTEDIVRDAVYPVCAPGLAATIKPDSLVRMPLIHTDWGPTGASFPSWRNWFEAAGIEPGRAVQRGLSANSSRAALDLAISGLGVTLAQGIYCAQALEDGRLVRANALSIALRQPYCLTIPERSARRDVVAAFRNWLIDECRRSVGSPVLR
ncbi:LysR family transcriptional regulator [Mesorhizobium sp. WSM4303]|uniref:LysR substrate-binding domain-containing protein n=1 Tax=unclassified Mesorhizobium TaxID=325217 RepID=UPI00115F2886|nr:MULTISPECIES: LysR substrate-binding domain-containing protein [unclassified Mesorhizobium]TRC95424.1 LysR family transcriptional regulator [Mesorhizobium sp. WSM4306]TRD08944.1 LysR family transcriptional regulator [Mesorhizobium sp. WSM4303]